MVSENDIDNGNERDDCNGDMARIIPITNVIGIDNIIK